MISIVTQQNRAKDIVLHAAACTGSSRGVKGVYWRFHIFDCLDVDDVDDVEIPGPDVVKIPVEYWD